MFDIRFGHGIDELGALFEAAELCNVVDRKGSYYYFGTEKLGQVSGEVTLQNDIGALRKMWWYLTYC